jgi:hypothetical protein
MGAAVRGGALDELEPVRVEDADQRPLLAVAGQLAAIQAVAPLAGAVESRGQHGARGALQRQLDARGGLVEGDHVAVGASAEGAADEAEVDGLEQVRLPGAVGTVQDDDAGAERGVRVGEVAKAPGLQRGDHHRGPTPRR